MPETPILGGYEVARSIDASNNRAINLYAEKTPDGKAIGAFFGAPGLDLLFTVGGGPVRQIYPFNGRLIVISESDIYLVDTLYNTEFLGSIGTASGPVSIIDNGLQAAIFDGISGWLIEGDPAILSGISLPFSGPVSAGYQDGFGFVNQSGTNVWWQSDLFDLSTWDALNFSSADAKPDDIQAIGDVHREVWLFKTAHTEVWINAGLPGFAFQRLQGVFIEAGCVAPASVANAQETILWLGQTTQGQGRVYQTDGYTPKPVSTPALETALASYSTLADAIGYSYKQEGHTFYVLTFPTADKTWTYDLSTGLWFERAAFDNGQFGRHWSNCGAFWNGLNVVGDYRNGNVYAYNLGAYTDAGTQRKWLRTWRALKRDTIAPVRFNSLEISMQTGVNIDAGANPQVILRWSDDGGYNWSDERIKALGGIGATAERMEFNQLGATRRGLQSDRIFELSATDVFPVAIMGAVYE